ncbi:hypothetical protein TIFTF001_010168 [Ficus carica]|uniref:Endoglucanase n=1 Tax=Ficus carica TaxID=3494 RepID=A0AA88ABQ4_FICCA|nr:hypothetical protein TIFTF001_010168 [Ficus carica]
MGSSVVVQGNKGFILLELCMNNIHNLDSIVVKNIDGVLSAGGSFAEFGWDSKHAAVIVLFSRTNSYVLFCRITNKISVLLSRVVHCGNVVATPARLIQVAKSQVDYKLGTNPLKMSYMVGYGKNFPQRIHHRGSSLPSKDQHQERIKCNGGTPYFNSNNPNHNLLIGAVVGGPDINDSYSDSRSDFVQSEPTTYINAPPVGVLAYFKSHPY